MGKLKYHWQVLKYDDEVCGVSCPVCGRDYRVEYEDAFRFCPECGQMLNKRKLITQADIILAQQKQSDENEIYRRMHDREYQKMLKDKQMRKDKLAKEIYEWEQYLQGKEE